MNQSFIISKIIDYMQKYSASPNHWYVGITNDPEHRLFVDHGVMKYSDVWIYESAIDSNTARAVEKYFIEVLGTDGGSGGGEYNSNVVYLYKKGLHTKP